MLEEVGTKEEATRGDLAVSSEEGKIGINVTSGKHLGCAKDKGKQANRRENQTDQRRE